MLRNALNCRTSVVPPFALVFMARAEGSAFLTLGGPVNPYETRAEMKQLLRAVTAALVSRGGGNNVPQQEVDPGGEIIPERCYASDPGFVWPWETVVVL